MPRKETYLGPVSAQSQQDLVSEGIENLELPNGIVMNIAKASIPDNVKLQKETVLSLVKDSRVFINLLAATAYDIAQSKQHKSISASDVLKALETIELGDMVNKLQAELLIYRELCKNEKGKKSTTTNGRGSGSDSEKKGLGVVGGSRGSRSASASTTAKGKIPPASGPFTSVPLGLPTAHSPMDIDHEAESVSVAPPIPMQRSSHIERSRNDHELDGEDEESHYDLYFELFQVHWRPEFEMSTRGTGDEVFAGASASASTIAKGESKEKPTEA